MIYITVLYEVIIAIQKTELFYLKSDFCRLLSENLKSLINQKISYKSKYLLIDNQLINNFRNFYEMLEFFF